MTSGAEPVRSSARDRVLERVASGVLEVVDRCGRARIGVDGRDGAGKTRFADELATVLSTDVQTVRATIDHFHHPKQVRYRRGRGSPEGFYLDSYDLETLRHSLLDPAGARGSGQLLLGVWDVEADAPRPSRRAQVGERAVLVVDGIFLHRPELRDVWEASVYLDVDPAQGLARCAARGDGVADLHDPRNRRYVEGQELYHRSCRPAASASWVIDNRDLAAPVLVAARP